MNSNDVTLQGMGGEGAKKAIIGDCKSFAMHFFDKLNQIAFWMDLDENFVCVNDTTCKALGYSREELQAMTLCDIIPGHEKNMWKERWEEARQHGSYRGEFSLLTRSGDIFRADISFIYFESGEKQRMIGLVKKLDCADELDGELEQSGNLYRNFVDNLHLGIIVTTPEMEIISVNQWVKNRFPEIDVSRRPKCYNVLHGSPDARICNCCPLIISLNDGKPHESYFDRMIGNEHIAFRIVSSTVKDRRGRVIAAIITMEDITDRKQAEKERRMLEQQVLQARHLEAIGSLAAGIAHEINTPIQFVGDNTRFLSESFESIRKLLTGCDMLWGKAVKGEDSRALDEERTRLKKETDIDYIMDEIPGALEQTLDGVNRVAKIVRSMKDFAHQGTDEKSMSDINQMLESTLTIARNELKYVADVITELDPELPQIECYRSDLNQVFLNILVNAAHAIESAIGKDSNGKGTITVSTAHTEDKVIIKIKDTGIGIPGEIQDRIFDPFFTTKEVGKGTGQGLAIARSIIMDKHNGKIEFETETGRGTTFIIKLPVKLSNTKRVQNKFRLEINK